MHRRGKVVMVNPAGVGMIRDSRTKAVFGFTFGQIKNYRGESARELGLRTGREVDFEASDDKLESITIATR